MCEATPCVVVYDPDTRINSETELCGAHFFNDRYMLDPERWNEPDE